RAKVSALLHDGGYGSAGAGRQRPRRAMGVAEGAGSLVLVVVGGLCIPRGGGYGSAGAGRQRLRSAMVVAQVAGSLVLLIVAGLCIRSVQRAQTVDLGFDPRQILTVRLDPHQIGYD